MKDKLENLILEVVTQGTLELRDVPEKVTNEDVDKLPKVHQPFLYASGNWGPGYISIKGLVAKQELFEKLIWELYKKVEEEMEGNFSNSFVAGNATGGMIPGWVLSKYMIVPYVYVRESRKKGGQKEVVTGAKYIPENSEGIIVEELVNFAESTCNSALYLRELGFKVNYGTCILFYNNPESIRKLSENGIKMIYLFTLSNLLDQAEQFYDKKLVNEYRIFLRNPLEWQAKRGLTKIEKGGTL